MIWKNIVVAFSLFSALPMPQVRWTKRNMCYCLLAFPLVGAMIGVACWLWVLLCRAWRFPELLQGAGLCLLPVLLTGGIHLDGYVDTCDALASHGKPAQRRQILQDPHVGAFAVIRLAVYFMASFTFWTVLPTYRGLPVLCLFCLSRCLSGIAIVSFPLADGSGMARSFAEAANRDVVFYCLIGLSVLLSILALLTGGWAILPAAALCFLLYYRRVQRDFAGLSGDLAGWFVQKAELWMLGALCFWQLIDAVL